MSKAILKEARKAINLGKLGEAVEMCEKLLKDEPNNYMAYLLLGAAYQTTNKAEATKNLRKAIEYSPDQPTLALQGLANCAPIEELPKIYEQLLELVPDKFLDYIEKVYEISANSSVSQACLDIIKKYAISDDEIRRNHAVKYFAMLAVGKDLLVNTEDLELLQNGLEEVIKDVEHDLHLPCYKRYLKLLFKSNEMEKCLEHACLLTELQPSDVYAYEWICKIYCENYNNPQADAWWTATLRNSLDYYASELLKLNNNSGLALLVDGIRLFKEQQYLGARDKLQRVLEIQANYSVAQELLARTHMELGAYSLAQMCWQQLGETGLSYATCLSYSKDSNQLNEALEILLWMESSADVVTSIIRCYFHLGQLDKLKEMQLTPINNAEFLMEPTEAIKFLKSLDVCETFEVLILLGKFELKLANYSEALMNMLKATRLRPYRSECFFYLGRIYYESQDMVRARKCFEKCINLNPLYEDAIYNLNSIYQEQGEEELNEALLVNTLKQMKNMNSKVVHYKLGLHYMNLKKWDDAIQNFRTAIKLDVSCMIYWESLGDVYSERGSYNSAIRVYQKILEFDPGNIYAKLQIAIMKTTLRMYPEAIEDFDNFFKDHPDYLPALKGAAEAHLGLANSLKLENRIGRSKQHLQLAVNHIQRAFLKPENHGMVWLWRLAAYAFIQTAQMPKSLANLEVSGELAKRETPTVLLNRRELMQLATRFYTCALKLKQSTYLWYELAHCFYILSQFDPEDEANHLDLATKACQMAIQEDAERWQNWNLLGVIQTHKAIQNYPLAQHCFIKALQLDRKSYTCWTNLGALYLKLDAIKLANQAFQRAQQSSPIYPNGWIGQAMIAEVINEQEEALDLFRHCQQFQYHPESSLGYAHWVCSILTDEQKRNQSCFKYAINHLYGDVVALDAINWYSSNEEENASASGLTFQGFLSARLKLYKAAVAAYQQAALKAANAEERDKLNTNLGYLLLKLNKPQEAIKTFNLVTRVDFKPIVGLALAYCRSGQYQEAYSVYNSLLKSVAGKEDDKAAMILVAMASMVYAFQGEDDTKTILYQCILLKDSPIQALYSACALGILHKDAQLTETILSELKKYENSEEHCADIAYLTSQYFLSNNQARKGLSYLLSRVHIFPGCTELRNVLANYMMENFAHMRQYHVATSQIALSTISLGHGNRGKNNSCVEDSKSLMLASRALETVDVQRSKKMIQRAIHLNPQNVNAWHTLLSVY